MVVLNFVVVVAAAVVVAEMSVLDFVIDFEELASFDREWRSVVKHVEQKSDAVVYNLNERKRMEINFHNTFLK